MSSGGAPGGSRVDLKPALGTRQRDTTAIGATEQGLELTRAVGCPALPLCFCCSGESWSTFADTRVMLESVTVPAAAALRRPAGSASAPESDAPATAIRVRLAKSPRHPPGASCKCEIDESGFRHVP